MERGRDREDRVIKKRERGNLKKEKDEELDERSVKMQ